MYIFKAGLFYKPTRSQLNFAIITWPGLNFRIFLFQLFKFILRNYWVCEKRAVIWNNRRVWQLDFSDFGNDFSDCYRGKFLDVMLVKIFLQRFIKRWAGSSFFKIKGNF